MNLFSPLDGDGDHGEHGPADREDGHVGGQLAEEVAEGPLPRDHVVRVEGHVEEGDHRVRDAQVH